MKEMSSLQKMYHKQALGDLEKLRDAVDLAVKFQLDSDVIRRDAFVSIRHRSDAFIHSLVELRLLTLHDCK